MTATTLTTTTSETTATRPSLRRTTAIAGVAGAAITTAVAAAIGAAGANYEIEGEAIPLLGFAQMTLVGAIIGGVLMAVLNRRSAEPRRRFLQVTTVLTALSCLPSVAMPDDAGSKVALVALHVLAAAIIVPAIARHADA